MSLKDKLKKAKPIKTKGQAPLWRGPEVDGVTQGLLNKFLLCRERFRIAMILGLRPVERFNHRTGYGDMFHLMEETYLETDDLKKADDALREHVEDLLKKYPNDQLSIAKWYRVCQKQFPVYVDYWKKTEKNTNVEVLMQEQKFTTKDNTAIEYKLPSNRVVKLCGKIDAAVKMKYEGKTGIFLKENKTKADIVEHEIERQLKFDLQTMFYTIMLQDLIKESVSGVWYNVIRRPLSGGKHTIKQKQKQTPAQFYDELQERIREDPEFFFMRWVVPIKQKDIEDFKRKCLNPILEQLCDWYNYTANLVDPFNSDTDLHYQLPYGLYNPIIEGRETDLDEFMRTGSTVGLEQATILFPELE